MTDLETAARVLESFRDEVYPADIFTPIPRELLPEIDEWLSATHGRRIDGVSAFYYRRVLTLAAKVLRKLHDDLAVGEEIEAIFNLPARDPDEAA